MRPQAVALDLDSTEMSEISYDLGQARPQEGLAI